MNANVPKTDKSNNKFAYTSGYIDGINFTARNVLMFLQEESQNDNDKIQSAIHFCNGLIEINKNGSD